MVCCFDECHSTVLSSLNTIQGHSKHVVALNAELNHNSLNFSARVFKSIAKEEPLVGFKNTHYSSKLVSKLKVNNSMYIKKTVLILTLNCIYSWYIDVSALFYLGKDIGLFQGMGTHPQERFSYTH